MHIISGISVFCFAASYGVTFLLEVARLVFRRAVPPVLVRGFAAAGLLAQTLYLVYRASMATSAPLSSAFDWILVGVWGLAAVYLYLSWTHPKAAIGLFLLPLVLGLIGLARFADRQPFPQSRAGQVWGAIHGIFLLLGLVAATVGFVAGVMYLLQSYRLKHKLPPTTLLRLPSLEWLDRVNSRAIWICVLMVGAGFASGIVLNLVLHVRQTDQLPWSDPVIWRTAAMFAWLLAAAIFSAVYRPARSGRKVAYLTVANFVFLAASLVVGLLLPSEHGTERKAEGRKQKAEAAVVLAKPQTTVFIPHSPFPTPHLRLANHSAINIPCSALEVSP
jgi:ABC-type transport system involved in cytochrome c biogenesis permease subunit